MAYQLILTGTVQGVACRHYCSLYAKRMGIAGSASNRPDGTVSVLLNTSSNTEAEAYCRAVKNNTMDIRFWGTITGIQILSYTGPFNGDYEF